MAAFRMAAVLGDYYHKPEAQRAAIESVAGGLGAEVEVFLDPLGVPWDSLSRWAVLIMAREGRVAPAVSKDVWFTDAHEQAVSAFVGAGGALVYVAIALCMVMRATGAPKPPEKAVATSASCPHPPSAGARN